MPTEPGLTAKFVRFAKEHGVFAVKHSDSFRAGLPDVTITHSGWTSWWEFKLEGPTVKWANELQRLECIRLEEHGYCRLVIYTQLPPATVVIRPSAVDSNGAFDTAAADFGCFGYAPGPLLDYILGVHTHGPHQLGRASAPPSSALRP